MPCLTHIMLKSGYDEFESDICYIIVLNEVTSVNYPGVPSILLVYISVITNVSRKSVNYIGDRVKCIPPQKNNQTTNKQTNFQKGENKFNLYIHKTF